PLRPCGLCKVQPAYAQWATAREVSVRKCSTLSKTKARLLGCLAGGIVVSILPGAAGAVTLANPLCPTETVKFDPGQGQDIVVPTGFKVSVFASGLNFPTGIAFRMIGNEGNDGQGGRARRFEVFVLESGHGLPSQCNDEANFQTT